MTFDQMLETWRAQDAAPLDGVNRDLLQLVVHQDEADLRRRQRLEQWTVYGVSAGLAVVFGFFFWAVSSGDARPGVWDYLATVIALGATLLWAGALWVSRRRQALRERGFGRSLQEELRRGLSLVDYEMSRQGRAAAALLISAPMMVAAVMILWFGLRLNDNPVGWSEILTAGFLVFAWAWGSVWESRRSARALEPRRRRLSDLLDLLNANA